MKVIFCLFFILASCASQETKVQRTLANNEENLNFKSILPDKLANELLCKSEVREHIGRVGFQDDQWKRQVDNNDNLVYAVPSREFGKWIQVQAGAKPKIYVFSNQETRIIEIEGQNCEARTNIKVPPLEITRLEEDSFTDANLSELLNSRKSALIYIWSPSMIYSYKEMKEFKITAKKLGIKFIPLHDRYDSKKLIKNTIRNHKLKINSKKMKSLDLLMRGAELHFPSSFIVSKGRISKKIFGVVSNDILTNEVKAILDKFDYLDSLKDKNNEAL